MHVNRVGNLFYSLEEGIYKEARREMKSCKHISAIFLRGPYLDYKKNPSQAPVESKLQGPGWQTPAGEGAQRGTLQACGQSQSLM